MKLFTKGQFKADWTRIMEGAGMYECFHCGEKAVIWDSDFDTEDYGYEPGGIVHECHCAACGARITYMIPCGDDDDEETLENKN